MHKVKFILGAALLVLLASTGWQIGSCELANTELQDDMRDLASQLGTHIGLNQPPSDEYLRDEIIRRSKHYGIELQDNQIAVRRTHSGEDVVVHLSAAYTVPIRMPGFSFDLHFKASSEN